VRVIGCSNSGKRVRKGSENFKPRCVADLFSSLALRQRHFKYEFVGKDSNADPCTGSFSAMTERLAGVTLPCWQSERKKETGANRVCDGPACFVLWEEGLVSAKCEQIVFDQLPLTIVRALPPFDLLVSASAISLPAESVAATAVTE
jgi:hypothetical protein